MARAEHRNRGAGSALMAAILAEARNRGLEHVTVHSGRRAADFCPRNGFRHHRQILIGEPEGSQVPRTQRRAGREASSTVISRPAGSSTPEEPAPRTCSP